MLSVEDFLLSLQLNDPKSLYFFFQTCVAMPEFLKEYGDCQSYPFPPTARNFLPTDLSAPLQWC